MWELIRNNEEMYMIIYCIIILWINLDYLKDYRQLKTSLSDLSSDYDELIINPDTIFVMFFVLIFNFFRRWLFYILAVLFTQNILVAGVSIILFIIGLYSSIFQNSNKDQAIIECSILSSIDRYTIYLDFYDLSVGFLKLTARLGGRYVGRKKY